MCFPGLTVVQNLAEILSPFAPPLILVCTEAYTFYINLVPSYGFEAGEETHLLCYSTVLIPFVPRMCTRHRLRPLQSVEEMVVDGQAFLIRAPLDCVLSSAACFQRNTNAGFGLF